jgi:hypothetical protein
MMYRIGEFAVSGNVLTLKNFLTVLATCQCSVGLSACVNLLSQVRS